MACQWRRAHTLVAGIAGLVGVGIAAAVFAHLERGTTFFYDEWDFVGERRTGVVRAFLTAHNGHFVAFQVLVYRILFATVGLRHYAVYQAVSLALQLLCVLLVLLIVRRRAPLYLLAAIGAVLVFYGPGWQDLLWPFQIGFFTALAGGLGAYVLVDKDRTGADIAAMLCLVVAVASTGIGLPMVAGVAAVLLQKRAWRRLWVIAVPLVIYGVWSLRYGESELRAENVPHLPAYMSKTSSATVGGLAGLPMRLGSVLVVLLAALIAYGLIRHALVGRRPVPTALTFSLVAVVATWAAFGLARAQLAEPTASRYLYPGALLVVVVACSLAWTRIPVSVALLATAAAPFVVWSNSHTLRTQAAGLRDLSAYVRVELGALELSARPVDPSYRPDTARMPQVSAGPYFAAVQALGSPAASATQIRVSGGPLERAADTVLIAAERITTFRPATSVSAQLIKCTQLAATPGTPELTFTARTTLVVQAGPANADLHLRRFSPLFSSPPDDSVAASQSVELRFPGDRSNLPWHLRPISGAPVTICVVAPAP